MKTTTMKLNRVDEQTIKLRAIVRDCRTFQEVLRRLKEEAGLEAGRATFFAVNNGGRELYNQFRVSGE
jgi:hypothetical protein